MRKSHTDPPSISVVVRCLILSIVLVGAVQAGVRIRQTPLPVRMVLALAGACLGIHLVGWGAGWWAARWGLRTGRPQAAAVAFSSSQKTLPVGLYVANTFFPTLGLAALPMLVYHLCQLLCDTWIAARLSRGPGEGRGSEAQARPKEGGRGDTGLPADQA